MPQAHELLADNVWRYGKRVASVIERMQKGETLCCQHVGYERQWWLEPSNKTVGPVTAGKVILLPEIMDCGDAMFDGTPQTFKYKGDQNEESKPDASQPRV